MVEIVEEVAMEVEEVESNYKHKKNKMKNFFKKHIFARPTHFDSNSLLVMICGIIVLFAPIISCGPSKAELEAKQKRGFVWNRNTGDFEKSPTSNNIYETPEQLPQPIEEESDCCPYEDIEVRVIDSCEYIIYLQVHHTTGNIIHKANCRNPIHQNKN